MKFSDFNKRLMVAAWGIPVILFLILYGRWATLLFTLFVSLGFVFEFYLMVKKKQDGIFVIPVSLLGILWPVAVYFSAPLFILILIWLLFILTTFLLALSSIYNDPLKTAAYSILIAAYGILFPSMIIFLREHSASLFSHTYLSGGKLILSWLIIIWVCDTAAYLGGSTMGKRKLAPQISPNKTVEGFLSGIVGAAVVSVILVRFDMIFLREVEAFGMGILIGITGQIGDLFESRIKRILNVKDSSRLLPGHGGIMDRFDSMVFTAPFILIYILLISGKYFGA